MYRSLCTFVGTEENFALISVSAADGELQTLTEAHDAHRNVPSSQNQWASKLFRSLVLNCFFELHSPHFAHLGQVSPNMLPI